jgi:hypothetical protein
MWEDYLEPVPESDNLAELLRLPRDEGEPVVAEP